jgi:hypothetical protein
MAVRIMELILAADFFRNVGSSQDLKGNLRPPPLLTYPSRGEGLQMTTRREVLQLGSALAIYHRHQCSGCWCASDSIVGVLSATGCIICGVGGNSGQVARACRMDLVVRGAPYSLTL